ncbi:MAG: hypothetical protein J7480_03595, partial [Microbacteriaceae bacterium]|nr:hypothetical protein [Microbacteriaceae bacterium]
MAIVILGIVSLLASRLLVGAISTTSKLDRQQTAVAIATMQMEAVRGADAAPNSNGVSALFDGRPRDQQLALFNT